MIVDKPQSDARSRSASGAGFSATALCWVDWLCALALLFAELVISPLLIAAARMPTYLPGDARTHALAARQFLDHGLFTGWIDGYSGGFPAAVHYPIIGWLLIGIPARLGLEPATATRLVCTAAIVGAPILLYFCARTSRASISSSAIAALLFTWVSPLNPFVGGMEAFYMLGLVSQVLVIPFVILWATNVFGTGTTARASFWAGICFLVHPQVSASACILFGLIVVATANRVRLVRCGVSASFAALVAALMYAPAIRNLVIPFGWPQLHQWMHLGFGSDRLGEWLLDGTLLDRGRAPIITWLWAMALGGLVWVWRHPAARGAIAASFAGVALCTSGPLLHAAGHWGASLLAVFQPLRAMALVPLVACASVLVGAELSTSAAAVMRDTARAQLPTIVGWVARCGSGWNREWLRRGLKWGAIGLGIVLASALFSSRYRWFSLMGHAFDIVSVERPCGPNGPTQVEIVELKRALAQLRDGRLWLQDGEGDIPNFCAVTTQLEQASAVPISTSLAVGAHVGFASLVIHRLDTRSEGLSARAESLGIRHLLLGEELAAEAARGFERVGRYGPLHLYSRVGGNSTLGVGCVSAEWAGSDLEVRRALEERLAQPESKRSLLAPESLVSLVTDGGKLRRTMQTDYCSTNTAKLGSLSSNHSRHSATVTTDTPVDVVLRATAYPSWRITVDGTSVTPFKVFPGYYAVRIQPGIHEIDATTTWSTLTLLAFALALFGPWLFLLHPGMSRRSNHPEWRNPPPQS